VRSSSISPEAFVSKFSLSVVENIFYLPDGLIAARLFSFEPFASGNFKGPLKSAFYLNLHTQSSSISPPSCKDIREPSPIQIGFQSMSNEDYLGSSASAFKFVSTLLLVVARDLIRNIYGAWLLI